ncbi:MAG: alpha-L-rhamnosidase N-terminal domain-containing protein [Microbacteriaceae bacterium]|nr:alpha-L-rhamnosidase N-terminal domain-containing protein [Microbacteriaceae bacterium]
MSFDNTRWRGQWIASPKVESPEPPSRFGGFPSTDRDDTKVMFRREFSLDKRPTSARLRITSNSRHILFVNGRELLRGPIRSRARQLFYDSIDIGNDLVEGLNCIAVLVRHYGFATAWWEQTPLSGPGGGGGLVLEAEVHAADSELEQSGSVVVVSDASWRSRRSDAWAPIRPTDEISAQIPELFAAEEFDPSWTMPGYDDSTWTLAEPAPTRQFGRPFSTTPPAEPFGVLQPNPLPQPETETRRPHAVWLIPNTSTATDGAVALRENLEQQLTAPEEPSGSHSVLPQVVADGSSLVMDFGGIVSGVVAFNLTTSPGVRIAVSLLEALDSSALGSANRIEYTAGGNTDGYVSLEFMGGRYALLVVMGRGEVRVDDFSVTEHVRPRPAGPSFHCDDESLNRLHAVALRTVDLCSRDAYMDCPTREQRAWVGDSVIHQSVDLTNNTNWSLAIRNVQLLGNVRADGLLPMVAAADFANPGMVTIPDASLHWARTVHNLYRYTGDRELVADVMPAFESVLRWFLPFQRDDGLLHDVTGWVLIEWAPTEVNGAVASLNGLWARALMDFAEISTWLGDEGRASWARDTHARVRDGFERFWDAERELYVDSIQNDTRSRRLSEHAHAAAVTGGLVPASRLSRIAEVLLDRTRVVDPTTLLADYTPATFFRQTLELRYQPNWDVEHELVAAQPFFRYIVHDALALLGRADSLPELLHDWDPLLESGPSALREVWRGQSYAHAWSATPARDLILYVAGISPAEPGFDVVRVAPRLGRLRNLTVNAPTPHGPLHLEVKEGTLTLDSPRPIVLVSPDGSVREIRAGRTSVPWPDASPDLPREQS